MSSDNAPRNQQIVPSSAISLCPTRNMSPSHWTYFHFDGKCNHDRVCGYADEHGGPCQLLVEKHPTRAGQPLHDDGERWAQGQWRR